MAAPNYSYEKRQRELAKKRKAEEKRQKKTSPRPDGEPEPADDGPAHGMNPGALPPATGSAN